MYLRELHVPEGIPVHVYGALDGKPDETDEWEVMFYGEASGHLMI